MTTAPDAPEGPAALVQELGRRFRAGAIDDARALYAPGICIEQPASLPHGGRNVGLGGIDAMSATFARHWDRVIDPSSRLIDAGDVAVMVTTQTWTAKDTGRSATTDVVELFTAADGAITEIRVFPQDVHALLATLDPQ
ncbi:nuclear transport factor 2 family protein [Aquihabitans sp. McL0605]|uniref:nuclear transport factor 2 family protein n=1 Tax=Aquihabitans sp. McL0605 TaxID=3415671 RepID=UPI003CF604F8